MEVHNIQLPEIGTPKEELSKYTEEEIINSYDNNIKLIAEEERKIDLLKSKTQKFLQEAGEARRKFKDGDVVMVDFEKYRTPRKYIVRKLKYTTVWQRTEKGKTVKELALHYEISTENGHKPNCGWTVSERELLPYTKENVEAFQRELDAKKLNN